MPRPVWRRSCCGRSGCSWSLQSPGYCSPVKRMDRIGHRRLQFIGFSVMALCFLVLAIAPQLTEQVAPFLAILGLSYFFIQFGPNMTTFVLPSEVFPVSMRTTGHGIAAGIGKLGAFVGVFLVPQLQKQVNLRGMLLVAGAAAIFGFLLTMVLPEPARRNLEEVSGEDADNMTIPALDLPTVDLIPGAQISDIGSRCCKRPCTRLSRLTLAVAWMAQRLPVRTLMGAPERRDGGTPPLLTPCSRPALVPRQPPP